MEMKKQIKIKEYKMNDDHNDLEDIRIRFEERNIELEYFHSRKDLINSVKSEMEHYKKIGIGNSQTLKSLKISELAIDMGKTVFDKTLAETPEDIKHLKKMALVSDCYITSCNAFSKDGRIVNVDHSGNRVAAITYGPERVLIIVGMNKLVNSEKDAINRALTVATPLNAKRAKIESPCSRNESCEGCTQINRVCNYVSIIKGQHYPGRMKLLIINEDLGF
jgi:hypothetical protein